MTMYFSGLKRLIGSVEEKLFYDVALLFLRSQGYEDISIVDGRGDGGRDVVSKRMDLRIQLSVRKDWENKINDEAGKALKAGKRHLIYITNRVITPDAEAEFTANKYKFAGRVETSIYDLNFISSLLAQRGVIQSAYQALGVSIEMDLHPTPKEIAVSSVLLFGAEARELRERVIEANICATLLDWSGEASENDIAEQVIASLPGVDLSKSINSAFSSLRTAGAIVGTPSSIALSEAKRNQLVTAQVDFTQAVEFDIQSIMKLTSLSTSDARMVLAKSRELLIRGRGFHGSGPREEDLRSFLAQKRLLHKRASLYTLLAEANSIRQFQYGAVIDQIFSTNTFDIYRALGGKTKLTLVLDTSVAIPFLLDSEFSSAESRYGMAVSALADVARAHDMSIMVPSVYVNEMAGHGRKAIEYLEFFPYLPEEAITSLRHSRNAYLSHYAYMTPENRAKISLDEFLAYFGLVKGYSLRRMENRITSMLNAINVNTGFSSWYDQRIKTEIEESKPDERIKMLIEHDASVCTNLLSDNANGYLFATWDNVMIDIVQDTARVFADNPARINDTLSIIDGAEFETDRSHELLFTLLYMDEQDTRKLAEKLDDISSADEAFQLRRFVEEARARKNGDAVADADILEFFEA